MIRANDVSFLSIMKSRRTWIRYFLQTYLERSTGISLSLAEAAIPRIGSYPSIYFHHGFFEVYQGVSGDAAELFDDAMLDCPLVLLTRDPRDVVVSYYYYVVERDPERLWKAVPSVTFDDFLVSPVYGLERIARVELLERDLYARHPGPKLWMTYEDISASPQLEFEKLLRFRAPYPVDTAAMEAALVQSGFDDMQKLDIEIGRARAARQYVRLGIEDWSGDVNELSAPSGRGGGFRQLRPDLADAGVLCRDFPITTQSRRV